MGAAGIKQSLGSKNNGGNVSYIYAIIFILAIPNFTRSFVPSYNHDKFAKFIPA